jgi:integral membrane protein (TIGR00529 family)
VLPAAIGLLPVGGGALMSAPLVEAETEKLGLREDKKTYVNLWFRHTIFPVYPVSQVLILAATLTGVTVTTLVIRQIPVVAVMVVIGYLIGLRKTPKQAKSEVTKADRSLELRRFVTAFLPILATIVIVVVFFVDVSIAPFVGIAFLLVIAKPRLRVLAKPLRSWAIWGITLAAYGAFLLRNVADAIGISQIFGSFVSNGSVDVLLLLIVIPAFLGAITGSPSGGIAISVSILAGIVSFTGRSASLLYMSSYLGYLVAPTHLCLILTAEYFKCPLGKLYKYLIPSLLVTFAATILMYLIP